MFYIIEHLSWLITYSETSHNVNRNYNIRKFNYLNMRAEIISELMICIVFLGRHIGDLCDIWPMVVFVPRFAIKKRRIVSKVRFKERWKRFQLTIIQVVSPYRAITPVEASFGATVQNIATAFVSSTNLNGSCIF